MALAGWFGTPVIFLSGDQAAAEQLHAIVPDAETAVVKEGLSNYACISLSADAARRLIRQRAAASMTKIGRIQPYRIEGPVTIQIEYTSRSALGQDAGLRPGAEILDARTIRFRAADFLKAGRLHGSSLPVDPIAISLLARIRWTLHDERLVCYLSSIGNLKMVRLWELVWWDLFNVAPLRSVFLPNMRNDYRRSGLDWNERMRTGSRR